MKRKFFNIEYKSLQELGATTQKEMWEKVKAKGYDGLCISCQTVLTKDADNKFHAVFSTASEDRHGDVVEQSWDLKHFKKNPVYLDSHNYDSIENIIGRVNSIKIKDGALQGDIEFALDNPKGALAYKLAEKGFLNTSSVGFIPKAFSDKGNIMDSELLEISAVSVPANAEALFEKDYEPNDSHDDEDPQPEGGAAAGDDSGGEADGGGSESAGDGDGGISEGAGDDPAPESNGTAEPAVSPQKLVANAVTRVAQEMEAASQRRAHQLNNVLRAVKALGELPKVETPERDRAIEKRVINSAIRQLIKQKQ